MFDPAGVQLSGPRGVVPPSGHGASVPHSSGARKGRRTTVSGLYDLLQRPSEPFSHGDNLGMSFDDGI